MKSRPAPRLPPPDSARRARTDLAVLLVAGLGLFVLLVATDAFERFAAWARAHAGWDLEQGFVALGLGTAGVGVYALRRWRDLAVERERRLEAEQAAARLEGLLPLCSGCKRIRDQAEAWVAIEEYVAARSEAEFTHGICPDCRSRLYPDLPA